MGKSSPIPLKDWILVPSLITLGVTVFRLVGELLDWSDVWFSKAPGGGGSPIGIVWLAFVFGAYFGWKLTLSGHGPESPGKVIGFALLAFVIGAVGGVAGFFLDSFSFLGFTVGLLTTILSWYLAIRPWPELGRILTAYGLAARIPVSIVMIFAIYGNWGTHYDAPPPNYTGTEAPFLKWILIGPRFQLINWIALTCIFGALCAGIAAIVARRKVRQAQ